jgi:mono/diheme cytochrome c family protein
MRRAAWIPGLGAVLVAVGVLASGCGTIGLSGGASRDLANGKQQFINHCGSCHTLADAGTTGKIGPDLDAAFEYDRKQGFDESSFVPLIRDQIAYAISEPVGIVTPPTQRGEKKAAEGNPTRAPGMPKNLVRGADADDVAAYVASVAGKPVAGGGATSPTPPAAPPPPAAGGAAGGTKLSVGKSVFEKAGCTGCHTLKDAGATGTVGPNLDQKKPPKALVVDRVTNGKGVMPSFKGRLSDAEIDAVATYVSSVAGK